MSDDKEEKGLENDENKTVSREDPKIETSEQLGGDQQKIFHENIFQSTAMEIEEDDADAPSSLNNNISTSAPPGISPLPNKSDQFVQTQQRHPEMPPGINPPPRFPPGIPNGPPGITKAFLDSVNVSTKKNVRFQIPSGPKLLSKNAVMKRTLSSRTKKNGGMNTFSLFFFSGERNGPF